MSAHSIVITANAVVWVLVLLWVFLRQVRVRPVTNRLTVPLVLVIVGVLNLGRSFSATGAARLFPGDSAVIAVIVVLVSAGLGAVRAFTVKLWRDGEQVLRQGTWLTILLWLVSIAVRVVVDFTGIAGHPGEQRAEGEPSFLLIYLGVTLLAQQLTVVRRARLVE